MEIMVLRSAMGFDPTDHKWKVKQLQDMKEHNLDPSIIKEQLGTGMYTEHVKFVKTLHQLTSSNTTIMTLMFVIEIFSPDRPNLKNTEAVTKAQDKFSCWLQLYLESVMPVNEARGLYPKLLMKLLDVRDLGESSAKLASHLDITKLEPLLIEVFNLQKWWSTNVRDLKLFSGELNERTVLLFLESRVRYVYDSHWSLFT